MAILKQIGTLFTSTAGYFFSSSVSQSDDFVDVTYGVASDASYTDETLYHAVYDEQGNTIAAPSALPHHAVPPSEDPKTGAPYDNYYAAFALSDSVRGAFYTTPTSNPYGKTDETSLGFQEYDKNGNKISAVKNLKLGGTTGVKDILDIAVSASADFNTSFTVAYATYNPSSHAGEIDYERFNDKGVMLSRGTLRSFTDKSTHGLTFGTFFSTTNPNSGGQPDYVLLNRANDSQVLQVKLFSPDMSRVVRQLSITDTGPGAQPEASTGLKRYGYLRPGTGSIDDFAVFDQTFEYKDSAGTSHYEFQLEKVDPISLKVEAKVKFAPSHISPSDTSLSAPGMGLQHVSNGDTLAIYNDGGQSYIREFDPNLHQVGATFALPHDDHGWDAFVSVGGQDRFEIFWRETAAHAGVSGAAGTYVQHHAFYQA